MFPVGSGNITTRDIDPTLRDITAAAAAGGVRGMRFGIMRALAGLTLLLHTFLYGMVAADAGWGAGERIHFTSAVIAWALTAVPLLALLVRPARAAVVDQLLAGALMILALLVVVGNPDNHGGQAGPYDPVYLIVFGLPVVVAILARRNTAASFSVRWPLVTVSLLAAAPAAIAAVNQELLQRNSWPPVLDPHHNGHWMVAGMAILAPVVAAAVAALGRRGWRLPLWTAGITAIVLGTVSVAFPADASSLGRGWGGALALWGVALLTIGGGTASPPPWAGAGRRRHQEGGGGRFGGSQEYPFDPMQF